MAREKMYSLICSNMRTNQMIVQSVTKTLIWFDGSVKNKKFRRKNQAHAYQMVGPLAYGLKQ